MSPPFNSFPYGADSRYTIQTILRSQAVPAFLGPMQFTSIRGLGEYRVYFESVFKQALMVHCELKLTGGKLGSQVIEAFKVTTIEDLL